ncbi:MAG: hypothetical protein J6Z47_01435 [Bacteroidales bacterium]|nr:hypothetical protein [Bacteroidales bacterium]
MNIEKGGMSAAKATGGEQPELGGEKQKKNRMTSSLNDYLVILFPEVPSGIEPL